MQKELTQAVEATWPSAALALQLLADKDAEIAALKHERNVLQKINARRSDGLEAVGLHADCTLDEASALAVEVAALRLALTTIAELDPEKDSDEGYNEWGEADCFKQAVTLAQAAIAQAVQPLSNVPDSPMGYA